MKNVNTIIRIITGLAVLISGINKFGFWINISIMSDAMQFVTDLINIGGGFIIYVIAIVEVLIGISLITNKYTYLALLVLVPMMFFIVIFHIILSISSIFIALVVFTASVYLFLSQKDKTLSILKN